MVYNPRTLVTIHMYLIFSKTSEEDLNPCGFSSPNMLHEITLYSGILARNV